MANTIRIKRRASGGATGAPSSLENAELAFNEADDTLYYGKGTGGAGGTATSVEAIAGSGAYVTKGTDQTITGGKTFSGAVALGSSATATTKSSGNNSTAVATTAYVDAAVVAAGTFSFNLGSYAVASGDTIQIVGGTGLTATISDVSSTTTATLDLDNTTVTAGSYGSSNSIPTFTVDAQGRLTAAGSASISTSFTLGADSGDNLTISGGDTLTIVGGTGLTSVASATDTLTINLDNTAVSAGSYGSATAVSTFTVDAQGRLTAAGTANIAIATSAITAFAEDVQDVVAGQLVTNGSHSGITATYDDAGDGAIDLALDSTAIPTFAGLTINGASITFEGATANDYETILAVTDPTADRTITLPNATGTVALTSDLPTSMSINVYGDSGVTSFATTTAGSGSFTISGGTGLTAAATSNTLTIDLDNTAVTAGSYGSSTAVGSFTVDAQGRLTAASSTNIRVASTTQTGLASFDSGDFSVSTGEVSIKSGGVDNSQLANSTITLGSSTLTLGSTTTSVAGITELTVDNLNFNGNSITSTDTNGNITLSPNGTGTVDVASSRITGLSEPSADSDAATKYYVDNKVTGLTWKQAVNMIAFANVPLTGSTPYSIDNHALSNGYRVLLTEQSTDSENGIYDVAVSGGSYTLTRAADANVYTELHGASVFVSEGDTYKDTGWVQTADYLTSFENQVWVQFSGAGVYAAGAGLSISGTEFAVNVATNGGIEIDTDALQLKSSVAGAGLTYSSGVIAVGGTADKITVDADAITIASTYAGQSSITTLGTIATGTWNATAIAVAKGGTGATSASDARTNLGLSINTDVQAYNANLAAIAGLTSTANALPYFTGSGTATTTTLSTFIIGLLDDADAAAARTTLGIPDLIIDGGTF